MADKRTGADEVALLEYEREKRRSYSGMCAAAVSGDAELARDLLRWAGAHLTHQGAGLGVTMPAELAMYIGRALGRIANDEDPAVALNLKRRKGIPTRPDYWKMERDADLARGVQYHRDQGKSLDEAARIIADGPQGFERMVGRVDFEAVRKAYLRFHRRSQGKR